MSFSSRCASRREVLALTLLAMAGGSVKASLPEWPERGQGRMRFLGLSIYDITLSAPAPVQAETWAAQALMLTVRARALLDGRLVPNADDVRALARPVMIHRMALSFAARARGESLAGVIDGVVSRLAGLEAAA